MKHSIGFILAIFSGSLLYAQEPSADAQSELLSAKVAYQQALSRQSHWQQQYQEIQKRLDTAKRRLADAQQEMQAAQKAYEDIIRERTQSDQSLQAAGARLDAAWAATRR